MADIVKEIFAGTLTVADIASTGSATLVTTDANTQYVIKDVSTSGVFYSGDSPSLLVNDFAVADLKYNATGSEIVDINSVLKYRAYATAPALTANVLKVLSGTSGSYVFENGTYYAVNGVVRSSTSSAPVSVASNLPSSTNNFEFSQANDGSVFWVQWDGNSSAVLYKRSGGINGTETQVDSQSYGWFVFNGVDTYYCGRNGQATLYKYNINTGALTTTNVGFTLSTSSYPSASLMNNGYLLVNPTGNSQPDALWVVDPATGSHAYVTGLQYVPVSGNTYNISGFYDSVSNRYTFYKRFDGALYKTQLNGALTLNSSTYSGGVTNTSYTIGTAVVASATGNYNTGHVRVDATNYTVGRHGVAGKTDLVTYNTVTGVTTTTSWLPYRTQSDTVFQDTTSAASPSLFTSTVALRITGVKSTF
jgi:hypothetical protein